MRSDLVVVLPPELDLLLRVSKIRKPILIKTFISKSAIEALDMAVLGRLRRADKMQRDPVLKSPAVERLRDKFRPVVDADALRLALHRHQQREHGDDALASDRRVHLDDQALAGEAVDDVERLE